MKTNYVSPKKAVSAVKSGDRVFVHGAMAFPQALVDALVADSARLRGVEITHLHTEGRADYIKPEYKDSFAVNALFVGANIREAVGEGRAFYIPAFLNEIPGFFRKGVLPLDVALVHVSTPDKHGYCSLGTSVDVARAAVDSATYVIAQANRQMPRTLGDGIIHKSRFHAMIEVDSPLPEMHIESASDSETIIGQFISEMVEDGATLQMGIGAVPNAVLKLLTNHKNLGVHSEMFSDGVIELYEKGVITNIYKKKHPGKIVAGFVMGTRKLYNFVDDNPAVALLDIGYVNNPYVIMKNPKVVAINSAVEVDITGQVCSDSIGSKIYSGVGGQVDFIHGAALSEGGKPIIALPSVTSRGESRISASIKTGGGVVTTRAHVHYVVTEYGVANLYGKNLKQRAAALINIAHPLHREQLLKSAREMYGFSYPGM